MLCDSSAPEIAPHKKLQNTIQKLIGICIFQIVMSKPSASLAFLPPAVENQLAELGANLQIARKRRGESRAAWASRLGVTSPTLLRMERGDPKVSMGAYATALWLIGRSDQLPLAAAPHLDYAAAEAEARKVSGAVRRRKGVPE